MKDHKLLNDLWREVEAGRVTARTCGDLTTFKYTQDTHIKGLWNEANRQARGIIFRADGLVVARPFPKFFNLGENEESRISALPWKEGVEVYEKMDGSCGIGYRLNDRWALATPGSLESDQAVRGTTMLRAHMNRFLGDPSFWIPHDCTPIFEIIYPENRIVVDYQGSEFLSLLAIFEHNGEEWHPRRVDQLAQRCDFRRPKRFEIDLKGEIPFEDNSEGYVARFGNGVRVKVKSPTYLRIHRLLNYLSPKGVIDLVRGREYGSTLRQLPPAIAKDFDDIRAAVQQQFDGILTSASASFRDLNVAVNPSEGRKAQALWIQANVPNAQTGLVYGLLDGKDLTEHIWKLVLEKVKDEAGPRIALSGD
jgi:RNA ligase